MQGKYRILLLILTLMVIVTVVTWITIVTLYNTAFDEAAARLTETAQSWARIIESVARFDQTNAPRTFEGESFAATLSQLRDAHSQFEGFGESGEFTLAQRQGEQIVFLLNHRHADLDNPGPVPIDSEFAEPMRRALLGDSGTLVGLDYRGELVLAAHEPVAVLDLGIVAKIDLREVRAPFIRAGLQAGGVGLALIVLGTFLFLRIGNPMVRDRQESETTFRGLYDTFSDGLVLVSMEGKILRCNEAYQEMLGYSKKELKQLTYPEITPPQWHEMETKIVKEQILPLGRSEEYEKEYIRKDGTVFPISLKAWLRKNAEGRPMGIWGIVREISDHKKTEEQILKSLTEKELLLREIHHRVKNNLQVISSILNLQRRTENDPKLDAALASCHSRIATMALSHERLYRSEDLVNIDAEKLLRSIAENLFRVYGVRPDQVALDLVIDNTTLDLATANPCGMIANELISNALKHAFPDNRKGRIIVRLQPEGGEFLLVVADDGIGFPEGIDFRYTESLGLELVNTFVDQMGGRIEQHVGKGSEYRIHFGALGADL